jgi:hypothetical protein
LCQHRTECEIGCCRHHRVTAGETFAIDEGFMWNQICPRPIEYRFQYSARCHQRPQITRAVPSRAAVGATSRSQLRSSSPSRLRIPQRGVIAHHLFKPSRPHWIGLVREVSHCQDGPLVDFAGTPLGNSSVISTKAHTPPAVRITNASKMGSCITSLNNFFICEY